VAAKKKARKRKPLPAIEILSTAEIARLIDIATDSREKDGFPTEAERQEARRKLLDEYRRQVQSGQNPDRFLVVQAIIPWALQLLAKPDPARALEYFLGSRQRPGKRTSPKTINRHLNIAVCVVRAMRERVAKNKWRQCMTIEKAAEKVAAEHNLQTESVIEIYDRYKVDAKALVADEALVKVELGTKAERQASFAPDYSNWVGDNGMWGPPKKLP
jgi:hypothetical protein